MHDPRLNHPILLGLMVSIISHAESTLQRSRHVLPLSCNIRISLLQILSKTALFSNTPHQWSHSFEHKSNTTFSTAKCWCYHSIRNMWPELCSEIEALSTSLVLSNFNSQLNGLIPFFLTFHAFSPSTVPRNLSCAIYRCPACRLGIIVSILAVCC
jgi:hypothetical protein